MTHRPTRRVRVLIVPGLHGSGPAHWQTWLEAHWRDAVRVQQADPSSPDLERWAACIARTVASDAGADWVAVAHSFGTLALARHLAQRMPGRHGVAAALLVAPAEPDRFGVAHALPQRALGVPGVMLASDTDPWMSAASAARWSRRWGTRYVNLGDVGHINVDAGFGPFPPALRMTRALWRRVSRMPAPGTAAGWPLAA